jgi:hypothetical protein
MRSFWIVCLAGCSTGTEPLAFREFGLPPSASNRAAPAVIGDQEPVITSFPRDVVDRPTAVLECSLMRTGVDLYHSGAGSLDPLGEGLRYHLRVIRSPPAPDPSSVSRGSEPAEWFVHEAFAGPWEFGLQVEDAEGRLSEETSCRVFMRYRARLAVELAWNHHESAADLDIHVVQSWAQLWDIPGDCHFANPEDLGWSVDPSSVEDDCIYLRDDRGGEGNSGPGELMLFPDPQEGAMDVVIHEFASGAPEADEQPVMVRIWLDNRLIYDTLEQRPSTEWWVARVDFKTNTAIRLDPPVESAD